MLFESAYRIELEDGALEVSLDVPIDYEIVSWILGFGSAAEGMQPVSLRRRISEAGIHSRLPVEASRERRWRRLAGVPPELAGSRSLRPGIPAEKD
ncbi:MAG: WYL domain-containing protein [Desulfomonilaceae bacterium]